MSGGGKGGSQTESVQIPQWAEDAATRNLARADALSKIGYVPYFGPDVAAMTPMQMASMGGTNAAASAFGLGTSAPGAGMPQATDYNGMAAYSSAPMYQQALASLQANAPGQYDALMAPFINPVTGAMPAAPFGNVVDPAAAAAAAQQAQMAADPRYSNGIFIGGAGRAADAAAAAARGGTSSGSGTGSFGLPDPGRGNITGTNFSGPLGGILNSLTR